MISLPSTFSWQLQIVQYPGGPKETAIIMAATMEKAYETAKELYPQGSIRVVGMMPEWDETS